MFESTCKYQVCLLAVLLCFFLSHGLAQHESYNPSKRAKKNFDSAVEAYVGKEEGLALKFVNEAIARDSFYYDAWMLRSQLLQRTGDFNNAAASMSSAMRLRPVEQSKYGMQWCGLLHRAGSYKQALAIWESLVVHMDDEGSDERKRLEASLRFSVHAVSHPELVEATPLKGHVNTERAEYYPAIFISSDRMIFTRQVGIDGRFNGQEDFFEAQEINGVWEDMGAVRGVNTSGNEGAPSIRGDGRRLIFTACETLRDGYGPRKGQGSCDLFEAEWNASIGAYDQAVNLEVLNTRYWESQPSLSADGNQIYFVRAQRNKDGLTEQNIMYSNRNRSEEWGVPQRLSSVINTIGKEENPVLHPDGKTLYFASDGHPGLGGLDLFVSRMSAAGEWMTPVNLGYPINTNGDENSLQVFPNGRRALFASDRAEPGNLDLYEFDLPLELQAESVLDWSGRVFDEKTGNSVEANVLVYNVLGKQLCSMKSDRVDGVFSLPVCADSILTFEVNHPDYGFYHRTWSFAHNDSSKAKAHAFFEIPLSRLEVGTVLLLRDVKFETNSSTLGAVFQPELDQLVSTMESSEIRIRIVGHTDDEGSADFNQKLSESRAISVADYLEKRGISQERLETIGMGAEHPIAANDSDEGRALNRRTEIVVID